jgi:hypothetical protein
MPFDATNYKPIPEGHRRLLVLAEFLETKVPWSRFDLGVWSDKIGGPNECGTTACACGWGTTIAEFRVAGFRLVNELTPGTADDGTPEIAFGALRSWPAIQAFFEISDVEDAYELFWEDYYPVNPAPSFVAARIRTFVAEQAKVAP